MAAEKRKSEQAQFEQKVAAEKQKSEYTKSIDALKALHTRWVDAVHLANNTARIQLSGQIAALQAIKRDTEAALVPPCLTGPKASLVESMATTIDGFIAFMSDPDIGKYVAQDKLSKGQELLSKYEQGLSGCGPDIQK